MDEQYKCGYCKYFINSHCEDYTSHECFMQVNFDASVHNLVVDENGVLTLVDKHTNTTLLNKDDSASWEEVLIKFVQDRPPLYNIRLPVAQRSNLKKNNLWAEIYTLLGGKHTLEEIKAKWRYLRDCYIRARKKMTQYKPSGSAAGTKCDPGFRYYDNMQFLNDTLNMPVTVSSVPLLPNLFSPKASTSTNSEEVETEVFNNIVEAPETLSTKKRRQDEKRDFQKGVLDMLTAPPKALDGVDGFLIRLEESLRRFPYRERSLLEIDIMRLVHDRETELDI